MKKNNIFIFVFLLLGFQSLAKAQTYQWRIAETWPQNFPIFSEAVEKMSALTHQLSNGRLTIRSYPREVHKRPLGVFDMVRSGEFEMGHSASYFWKDWDINTLFFTTLPFGMTANEQYSWFYYGGGIELMQKTYAPYGVLSFPGGNTGNQMGGWFRKEIKSIKDLHGLIMSVPGLASDAFVRLGVQTINLPAEKLLKSLESGAIDALEWVGPSQDLTMGFHKVAPFYYTGWHEPATELQFLVNKQAYNKLPQDLQLILTVSMRLAAYDMYFNNFHVSANNLSKMRDEYPNIKIRAFPRDVIRELRKHIDLKLTELRKSGSPLTKEILASIDAYKATARQWTLISDQAFLNNGF